MWYNLYVNKSEAQNTAFNKVAILSYELKTEKVTQSVAFFVLIFSIEFEQRLPILNS